MAGHAPAWIPWAWGVNGCASVVSAILATLLAIHLGFVVVVLAAVVTIITVATSGGSGGKKPLAGKTGTGGKAGVGGGLLIAVGRRLIPLPDLTSAPPQLDYPTALDPELPIGSGEIESAHRYIIREWNE